jgi:MerR family transcriptional regulator, copper efflux regulator
MRIQEAAERLGISTRMLRHYEAKGLVAPRRASNGYRSFTPEDLGQAAWVRDLIAAGFSARELHALLRKLKGRPPAPGATCGTVMHHKLDQLDRLIALLTERRRGLANRLAAFERREPTEHGGQEDEGS